MFADKNLGTDIVFSKNGSAVTTSRLVAAKFGKNHAHILRDIKQLECSKEFNESNFGLVEYVDAKGEKRPEYEISRDGFVFLVMGFTGKQAAKFKEEYINAFNAMEIRIKQLQNFDPASLSRMDILNMALDSEKRAIALESKLIEKEEQLFEQEILIERKEKEIKQLEPKGQYFDKVMDSKSLITTTVVAQHIGMTAYKLNSIMKEKGVQRKVDGTWVLTSKYLGKGFASTKTYMYANKTTGDVMTVVYLVWTEKGRKMIFDMVGYVEPETKSVIHSSLKA